MANYDDFVRKAKGAFDTLADASVDAYKIAEEKARILAKKTKLRAGIVNEKAIIRRVSVELGTKYYNKYKNDKDAEFCQLCEEITCAFERIALKEEEIAALKTNAEKAAAEKDTCDDDTVPLLESADIVDDQ
ncbi:MAG: hypothetical protein LBD23_18670 [Oscillospiraceae bacterium]|jgi:hypothetical protein|nr:hypothetical protein [Oscillospiraceae bacterium]